MAFLLSWQQAALFFWRRKLRLFISLLLSPEHPGYSNSRDVLSAIGILPLFRLASIVYLIEKFYYTYLPHMVESEAWNKTVFLNFLWEKCSLFIISSKTVRIWKYEDMSQSAHTSLELQVNSKNLNKTHWVNLQLELSLYPLLYLCWSFAACFSLWL